MAVDFPFPSLVDIRQPILGDSFGWVGLEPTAAKKSLVFHHSASDAPAEDGFSIADYHINHNGWGGIGYHLVITRKDYPGRAGFTNPGAQIQYVGDLGTWRAHVANQNPGRVGICFVGITPDAEQLKLGRALVDFLIAPNNILPSINFYNQVTVHRLVPDQSTSCPGDDYGNWLPYLQNTAPFPAYLEPTPTPPPVVAPIVPTPETPPASDLSAGKGGGINEYEATYHEQAETKSITRPGAFGIDVSTGFVTVPTIAEGTMIDVAGYFDFQGHTYARTVYSATHGKWNGLDVIYLTPPTGNTDGVVPVTVVDTPPPNPPDAVQTNVTDAELQAATVPEQSKLTVWQLIKELVAQIIARLIKRKI